MRNSDPQLVQARAIIACVGDMLDPRRVAALIDDPIDRAAGQFAIPLNWEYTHDGFQMIAGGFVRHLYAAGMRCPRSLSQAEARDEAVALLADAGVGVEGAGYSGALNEAALAGAEGMLTVLMAVAEALKERLRHEYARRVRLQFVEAADWPTRRAMAAILVQRWPQWPPPGWDEPSLDELARALWPFLLKTLGIDAQSQQPTDDAAMWPF